MISFKTERMLAKSEMQVIDGKLLCKESVTSPISLLSLQPKTGLESCFRFYSLEDEQSEICHIAIIFSRNRFEVSYGTEEAYRNNGFMKEALCGLIDWIFKHTNEHEIWGLPNGPISERILNSCEFEHHGFVETNPDMKWYKIESKKYHY